jgi:endoglucanase
VTLAALARPGRRLRLALLAVCGVCVVAVAILAGRPAPARAVAAPPAPDLALRGALPVPALWTAWSARFVTPEGRVVDDVNGGISHSESQGYGLILALAADDQATFRRIWSWTRANLYVRKDGLAAWRWQPGPAPNVRDPNNATDGDILVAWALGIAGEAWSDPALTVASRRIARAVWDETVVKTAHGPALLPAVDGFAGPARRDAPVVNPSYWVFPALAAFERLVPEHDWAAVAATGVEILDATRAGPTGLPPEWASLAGPRAAPAEGFPAVFGYNAVRVPLYLAWNGTLRRDALAPFMARWSETERSRMAVVDLKSGADVEPLVDPGYRAVAALVACSLEGTRFPDALRTADVDHYYPATLRALALIAVNTRHPTCW